MTLLDWLDQAVDVKREDGTIEKTTILSYFTELIILNGGSTQVTRWGRTEVGIGPYGRMGLKLDEALALINLSGIKEGFLLALTPVGPVGPVTGEEGNSASVMKEAFRLKVQGEVNRVKLGSGVGGVGLVREYGADALKKLGRGRDGD